MEYPEEGTKAGIAKFPASVDTVVRLTPFESFETVIIAPGMIAPLESLTTPATAPSPATDCAYAPAEKTKIRHTKIKIRFIDFPLNKPPLCALSKAQDNTR